MPTSPKILTVYYKHKPGGFCKRLRMQIEAYLEKGWHVHYVAVEPFPYSHPHLVPHLLPGSPRNHDSLPFWIYFFLVSPWYVLWVGLKEQVDFLSAVSPLYALLSTPAKWFTRVPMQTLLLSKPRFNTDCRDTYRSLSHIETWMEKRGLKFSDHLLANSQGSKTEWVKHYGKEFEKIKVLPNNVILSPFRKNEKREKLVREFSLNPDAFVIATASVLEPHKNLDFLLKTFAELNHPKTILLIIGDGVQLPELQRLAERLAVDGRTIFTGWREDVLDLIQGSDLYVFPSLREGMSESLLEAMTCGVPCLVSAIPENMEVARNPEQHFSPNHPGDLAKKIDRLIEDGKYRDSLLQTTREDIKRFVFDWEGKIQKEAEDLLNRFDKK
ncbi:MAG: glycosyltransferase family 4 protein [Nitrospinaceae bacterium]